MKTLFVTHGEWVSRRTGIELSDEEHDRLRHALEGEDRALRRTAQAEVLQRAQQVARHGRSLVLRVEDAALEALEFDEGSSAPRRRSESGGRAAVASSALPLEGL